VKKSDVVQVIFHHHLPAQPVREEGLAFAPTNIALCKYWGKRDSELNLPHTSSLSIALPDKGAMTHVKLNDQPQDVMILNGKQVSEDSSLMQRTSQFLDLFRPQSPWYLQINIKMNIPIAAGLASSACGVASLVLALKDLFDWPCGPKDLSILARLGSGSAARSFWMGFVEWHMGVQTDGMDCYAEPLAVEWPELRVGILSLNEKEKPISSREAMQHTVGTSPFYKNWPQKATQDLTLLKQALQLKKFSLLGGTAESNAMTMHAMMLSSWPPLCYFMPETIAGMQKIWDLRRNGLELYFTQDAGPNLKLLFLGKDEATVREQFPALEVVNVFE